MGRRQRGRPAQGPEGQAAGARHRGHQRNPVADSGRQLRARGGRPGDGAPGRPEALQVHGADGSGGAALSLRLAVARDLREPARRGRARAAVLLPVLRGRGAAAAGRVDCPRPARICHPRQARGPEPGGYRDVWHPHQARGALLRHKHHAHARSHHVPVLLRLHRQGPALLGARRDIPGHLPSDHRVQDVRPGQVAERRLLHAV
mmetsp:Transcript_126246/g.338724  ORF Transcript_126246/g.338724 Transcript_126246/m.338724 type:complete len:204 (-) Transcript_126246:543-1154(-)